MLRPTAFSLSEDRWAAPLREEQGNRAFLVVEEVDHFPRASYTDGAAEVLRKRVECFSAKSRLTVLVVSGLGLVCCGEESADALTK